MSTLNTIGSIKSTGSSDFDKVNTVYNINECISLAQNIHHTTDIGSDDGSYQTPRLQASRDTLYQICYQLSHNRI